MSERPRRSWRPFALLLGPVLVVLALLLLGVSRHDQSAVISGALARGETPPVPALSMQGFSGTPLSLRALRGHPVVLNFWASWCVPCRAEAPQLESMWRKFRPQGLVVVGVDTQDLMTPARAFVADYGLTFPAVRDPDGSVARRFGATGVPETFFISADGRILGKFPGEQDDPAIWRAAVEALLRGRPPQE